MFAPLTRGVARSAGGLVFALLLALLAAPLAAEAQQGRLYRVGVVLHGGSYFAAVDGLRAGMKELGFEEGKQFVLHLRDTRGDLKSVAVAARSLEGEKVDLIYSLATSVTLEVKRATKAVPIVFYAGTDPVALGLVESFRNPGGRLTGIHGRSTNVTGKRLQLLKEMLPNLRRVLTFYSSDNPRVVPESLKIARDAARQLKIELIERPVGSVEELRTALQALQPKEADALLYIPDAMMQSQASLVINAAMAKSLPAMFADKQSANEGALATYGVSYYAIGRLSAKYVQRILQGAQPGELPVEQVDAPHFVVNLKTAKALGIAIPPSVLTRADEVIQ